MSVEAPEPAVDVLLRCGVVCGWGGVKMGADC